MNTHHFHNDWRDYTSQWLVKVLYKIYRAFAHSNKKAWIINKNQLINYPVNSLGQTLGQFLIAHDFDLMEKFESHDVYHILLGYSTGVLEEIYMQCCLLGVGKYSLPTIIVVLMGMFFYPRHYNSYWQHYRRGKTMKKFTANNWLYYLSQDIDQLRLDYHINKRSE